MYSSFCRISRGISCCWRIPLSVERAALSLCLVILLLGADAVFQRKQIFWRLCGETPPSSLLLLAGLFGVWLPWRCDAAVTQRFFLRPVEWAEWSGVMEVTGWASCSLLSRFPSECDATGEALSRVQLKGHACSAWRLCSHTQLCLANCSTCRFPQGEPQAVCQTFPCSSGCLHKWFKSHWKVKYAEAGRGWRLQLLLLRSAEKRLRKPLKHLALSCLLFYGWKSDKMFWIFLFMIIVFLSTRSHLNEPQASPVSASDAGC